MRINKPKNDFQLWKVIISNNALEKLKILFKIFPNINLKLKNKFNNPILFYAIKTNDLNLIKFFIEEKKVDYNEIIEVGASI